MTGAVAKPMRIAVVARSLVAHAGSGGMERVTESLTSAWAARGHDVTVFTTPLPSGASGPMGVETVELQGKAGRYSSAWARRLAGIDLEAFDVVLGVSSAARTLLSSSPSIPVVMQAHGTSLSDIRTKLRIHTPRALATLPHNVLWLVRDLQDYRRYDAVVGVGPLVTLTLTKTYPALYKPRRYCEITNGVGVTEQGPLAVGARVGVLFVGRVHIAKGVAQAIRALPRSEQSLTVCGDGPHLDAMKALVQRLSLSDRVEFTGTLSADAVRARMRNAVAVVVPSKGIEVGLPLVALEALSEGTPVLASPGVAAAYGGSPPAGVVAVDLCKDGLDAAVAAAARWQPDEIAREARERFSLDATADSYLRLLADLIASKPRRAS